MEMHPIRNSSRILGYGYVPNGSAPKNIGMLALDFGLGGVWWYSNVPESVFEDFLLSDSKGKFFMRKIQRSYLGKRAEKGGKNDSGLES